MITAMLFARGVGPAVFLGEHSILSAERCSQTLLAEKEKIVFREALDRTLATMEQ